MSVSTVLELVEVSPQPPTVSNKPHKKTARESLKCETHPFFIIVRSISYGLRLTCRRNCVTRVENYSHIVIFLPVGLFFKVDGTGLAACAAPQLPHIKRQL